MKKGKTSIAIVLVMVIVAISVGVVGCGNKDDDINAGREKTLDIIVIDKGYGTSWLSALEAIFEDENPTVNVKIKTEPIDQQITKFLDAGPAGQSKYDLYFTGTPLKTYIASTMSGVDDILVDLTDIYDYMPNGTKTVAEMVDSTLLSAYKHTKNDEDVYYTMPWTQGINGFLVNFDLVAGKLGADWQETYPCRTTDELLDFCNELAAKDIKAFIYAAETHYYQFVYNVWWAQYEGMSGIEDYYSGLAYEDGATTKTVNKNIFRQQGRLESMKVMESIMTNKYVNPMSSGLVWDAMQTRFMAGAAAMLPNGEWNNIEMRKSFPQSNVQFIRTPVISSLGTKLGITEQELLETIDYVDNVLAGGTASAPTFTPSGDYTIQEVIDRVMEARCIVSTYAEYFTAAIPSWSSEIDIAKDFLKLMVSDRGQDAYARAVKGEMTLPYGYDITKASWYDTEATAFAKTRWQLASNTKYYYQRIDLPLGGAGLGGWRAIYSAPLEHLFYNRGYSAQDVINEDINYYATGTAWTNLLTLAGLL